MFSNFVENRLIAIDKRDPTTCGYSQRVEKYVKRLVEAVNECDTDGFEQIKYNENQLKEIYFASLLHDIGKIGVSESLLRKKNRLTDEGMEAIEY